MAATAQFAQFVMDTETVGAGWKLYHYNPGLLTTKNVWQQRAKSTTAAQPIVADANGVVSGYFDGLYDLAVYDEDDVLKYTFEDVYIADLSAAASAGAVAFPATMVDDADPNTLDDYEEGTWTPSIGGNATYDRQVGHYTKVGNAVTISCDLQILVIGTGSTKTVSGLPFPVKTGCYLTAACYFADLASNIVYVTVFGGSGSSSFNVSAVTAASSDLIPSADVFANSAEIGFSASYIAEDP